MSRDDWRQIECHAVNLWFEARDQSDVGKRYVLDVVLNRVDHKHFPDDFCSVIKQYKAFSWFNVLGRLMPDDPIEWDEWLGDGYFLNPIEEEAYRQAYLSAHDHYVRRTAASSALYYMTFNALIKLTSRGYIVSVEGVDMVQDHVFLDNIVWRQSKWAF